MLEPQEIKQIMIEQQKKIGCFKDTKDEKYQVKRIGRIAKFTDITASVIESLKAWGIPFTLCEVLHSKKQKHRITTDIFIPYANIVIRQVDMNEEVDLLKKNVYYECMKKNFYPIFIRSNETQAFVMEKLMNTLQKANKKPQKGFPSCPFIEAVKEKPKEEPKKKRPRIKAVKVEPRKKVNNI